MRLSKKRRDDLKTKNEVGFKKKDYKELEALSELDFLNCESDLDRLYRIREMLERVLPISEGMFKSDPVKNNVYALTNMIDRYQNVTQQIIDVNNAYIVDDLIDAVIKPYINKLLIELGTDISRELKDTKANKKIKLSFNRVFSELGKYIEDTLPRVEVDIKKLLR